jgi:hypothetical protein
MSQQMRRRPAPGSELEYVADTTGDIVRQLHRLNEDISAIRSWVTFFGWLTVLSLGLGLIVGIIIIVTMVRATGI